MKTNSSNSIIFPIFAAIMMDSGRSFAITKEGDTITGLLFREAEITDTRENVFVEITLRIEEDQVEIEGFGIDTPELEKELDEFSQTLAVRLGRANAMAAVADKTKETLGEAFKAFAEKASSNMH